MKYSGYYAVQNGVLLPTTSADTNSWGADAQSCLTPPTANPVIVNALPAVPQPLAVLKDTTGKTLSANGQVPGSTVNFRNPA